MRQREARAHAERCLPIFLRLHRLRRAVAPEARRLLRLLLLWIGALPARANDGRVARLLLTQRSAGRCSPYASDGCGAAPRGCAMSEEPKAANGRNNWAYWLL